ncbi:thermonuclease family protein [Endozoicomonas ascidiicola]|uniref:thermonuclease family protein n=1 Tax=Endozoicomonas ascidiicola TaxID=1698521 RepID=UPI00082D5515|nr:hypothetical protein [Endozoicomonas ascidiicola]
MTTFKQAVFEELDRAKAEAEAPTPEEAQKQKDFEAYRDAVRDAEGNSTNRISKNGRWLEIDGDTVKDRKTGTTYRLFGADAPESPKHTIGVHGSQQGAYTGRWFDMLDAAGDDGEILIKQKDVDVYGRPVAQFVIDGVDVTREVIRHGEGHRIGFDKDDIYKDAQQEFEQGAPIRPITRSQLTPEEREANTSNRPVFSGRNYKGNALARGVDQMQMLNYAFVEVLGQVVGSDDIQDWAHEGIIDNLKAVAENPAKVGSYKDVDSVGKVGTYVLEALAEEAPQLATDFLSAVVSGGSVATVKYGLGKALKSRLSKEAYDKLATRAAHAGAIGSFASQAVGEVQLELKDQGIEAPYAALGFGALNTGLDYASAMLIASPLFRRFRKLADNKQLTPRTAAMAAGASGATGFTSEALTELAQTVNTKYAAELNGGKPYTSEEFFTEYVDAAIKGGIVGGTLGAGARLLSQLDQKLGEDYTKASSKAHKDMDDLLLSKSEDDSVSKTDDPDALAAPVTPDAPDGGSGGGQSRVDLFDSQGGLVSSELVSSDSAASLASAKLAMADEGHTVSVGEVSEQPIVRADGKPYAAAAAKGQATKRSKNTGIPHEVVEVEGGFGVRPVQQQKPQTPNTEQSEDPASVFDRPLADDADLEVPGGEYPEHHGLPVLEEEEEEGTYTELPEKDASGERYSSVEEAAAGAQQLEQTQAQLQEVLEDPEQLASMATENGVTALEMEQILNEKVQENDEQLSYLNESLSKPQQPPSDPFDTPSSGELRVPESPEGYTDQTLTGETGNDGQGQTATRGNVVPASDPIPAQGSNDGGDRSGGRPEAGTGEVRQDDTGGTGRVSEAGAPRIPREDLREALDKITINQANWLVAKFRSRDWGLLDRAAEQFESLLHQSDGTEKGLFYNIAWVYQEAIAGAGFHRDQAAAVAVELFEQAETDAEVAFGGDRYQLTFDNELDDTGDYTVDADEFVDDGIVKENFEFSENFQIDPELPQQSIEERFLETLDEQTPKSKNRIKEYAARLADSFLTAAFQTAPTEPAEIVDAEGNVTYHERFILVPTKKYLKQEGSDGQKVEIEELTGRRAFREQDRARGFYNWLKDKYKSRGFEFKEVQDSEDSTWYYVRELTVSSGPSGEPKLPEPAARFNHRDDPADILRQGISRAQTAAHKDAHRFVFHIERQINETRTRKELKRLQDLREELYQQYQRSTMYFLEPLGKQLQTNNPVPEEGRQNKMQVNLKDPSDNPWRTGKAFRIPDIASMGLALMHDVEGNFYSENQMNALQLGVSEMIRLGYVPVKGYLKRTKSEDGLKVKYESVVGKTFNLDKIDPEKVRAWQAKQKTGSKAERELDVGEVPAEETIVFMHGRGHTYTLGDYIDSREARSPDKVAALWDRLAEIDEQLLTAYEARKQHFEAIATSDAEHPVYRHQATDETAGYLTALTEVQREKQQILEQIYHQPREVREAYIKAHDRFTALNEAVRQTLSEMHPDEGAGLPKEKEDEYRAALAAFEAQMPEARKAFKHWSQKFSELSRTFDREKVVSPEQQKELAKLDGKISFLQKKLAQSLIEPGKAQSRLQHYEETTYDKELRRKRAAITIRFKSYLKSLNLQREQVRGQLATLHRSHNINRDINKNPIKVLEEQANKELKGFDSTGDIEDNGFESRTIKLRDKNGVVKDVDDVYAHRETSDTRNKIRRTNEHDGTSLEAGLNKRDILYKQRRVVFQGTGFTAVERRFMDKLLDAMQVELRAQVMTFKAFYQSEHFAKVRKSFEQFDTDEGFNYGDAQQMVNQSGGMFFGIDGEAIIVLRDLTSATKEDRGLRMITLAHELGHAVQDSFVYRLDDDQKVLIDEAYQKDLETLKKFTDLPKSEWLADKLGRYMSDAATDDSAETKTVLESLAAKVKEFYHKAMRFLSPYMKARFAPNETVNTVADQLAAAHGKPTFVRVRDSLKPQFQDAVPGELKPLNAAVKKGISVVAGTGKIMYRTLRFLMTADRQLRDLGSAGTVIANLFYVNVGDKTRLFNPLTGALLRGGYFIRNNSFRNKHWSDFLGYRDKQGGTRISDYFEQKKWYQPHAKIRDDMKSTVEAGIAELNEKPIGSPFTNPFAKAVNNFLQDFHQGYLKEALPTIGHIPDYWPVQIKLIELMDRKSEFINIAVEHKTREFIARRNALNEKKGIELNPEQRAKSDKALEAAAKEHVQDIVDSTERGSGISELALNLENENYGPGFTHRKERSFYANKEMTSALSKAGFMEQDAGKMMFNYVASAVKRAEFERTFGGYKEMEGIFHPDEAKTQTERKNTREALTSRYFWSVLGWDYYGEPSKGKLGAFHMLSLYQRFSRMQNINTAYLRAEKKLNDWVKSLPLHQQEAWQEFTEIVDRHTDGRYERELFVILEKRGVVKAKGKQLSAYSSNAGLVKMFELVGSEGSASIEGPRRESESGTYERESGIQNELSARHAVRGYLGQLGLNMPRDVHRAMSTMMAYQSILILMFSTLSSFPDIVGGVLRNRDMAGMYQALKSTMKTVTMQVTDRQGYLDLVEQAKAVGLVGQRVSQQVIQELYGSAYTSEQAQKALDYLFTWNQQERWTDFTRVVNYEVAKVSLSRWVELAKGGDDRAKGYLKELGFNYRIYENWDGGTVSLADEAKLAKMMQDKPDDPKTLAFKTKLSVRRAVQDAHLRFVEESIVRPNAAHRPTWASDPRFMLLWHLKSFFYSYGKVIVAPFMQHVHNEIMKQGAGDAKGLKKVMLYGKAVPIASLPLLFGSVMLFGLAALGWEMKEAVQYRMWGKKGISDDLQWDDYIFELSQRSGVWGPVELGTNLFWGYGSIDRREGKLLGPTVDYGMTMLSPDITWKAKVMRSTPVLNQLTGLKEIIEGQ